MSLKRSLKQNCSGNLVLHLQSISQFYDSNDDDSLRCRRVLGIYKGFAHIDLLIVRNLEHWSEMKKTPPKITLGTINASFGNETIFTKLPHHSQKQNPQIFETIFSALEKRELEDVDDAYGQL